MNKHHSQPVPLFFTLSSLRVMLWDKLPPQFPYAKVCIQQSVQIQQEGVKNG